MRIAIVLAAALAGGSLSACTASTATWPVEVTRYSVDTVGRGTIALMPDAGDPDGLEFRVYADAVADALGRQGYTVLPPGRANAAYVARISVRADAREVRSRSPFSIGLGGGTFSGDRGGGVGLGGGVSFPVGRGKTREQVSTILSVKINTGGNQGVWEGNARTQEVRAVGTGTTAATAAKLANALFTGFPGESGRTIEVK